MCNRLMDIITGIIYVFFVYLLGIIWSQITVMLIFNTLFSNIIISTNINMIIIIH